MGSRHRGRLLLRVACLLALAVGGVAVPQRTGAEPVPRGVEALLVGDSVMAGMAQPYGFPARQLLAARHSFILDAKGCRRLITTSCHIGSSPPPTNAITAVKQYRGQYWAVLVMAVGYNDPTLGTASLDQAITVMMNEAHAQNIPYVVWLTYREAGPSAARFRAHNQLLRIRASTTPGLVIADWAARSAGLPTSWFSADGIHLGSDAAKSMADLIADTIDTLQWPQPATACNLTATTSATTVATVPGTDLVAAS
ncbi:MAG TPA: hypothetical protein VL916_17800, partial [Ilumatobacteraceae bacterium]|nr:hypothetical protein [Ilumatobacteraceae bacterium]